MLTAYLRSDPAEDNAYILQRDTIIDDTVHNVSLAFAPWKSPNNAGEARARNLTEIMKSAAALGIRIFSQPSMFEFDWGPRETASSKTIVIAPALIKVRDECGSVLYKAQPLTKRLTQKI